MSRIDEKKASPPKKVKVSQPLTTSVGKSYGYMGVTYDMLSDYELQNMVAKEQERTTKVRAPAPVERSYV